MTGRRTLRIPLHTVAPQRDIDSPDYRAANPSTYLLLALCHETLAGPSTMPDQLGVPAPNALAMVPRLAESWQAEGDHWVVRLRPGIRSHAGNELTAADLRFGLERVFAVGSTGLWRWREIFGLERPEDLVPIDRHTVRYRLRRPDPFFPTRLFSATPNLVDATAAAGHRTDTDPWAAAWLDAHVAGFGAYQLDECAAGEARFRPRTDADELDEIRLTTIASRRAAIAELASADPVYLVGLRAAEAAQLANRDDVTLVGAWAGHATLELDYSRPPFDDVRVRHALSYATPYPELIARAFHGLARPLPGPLKTYSPWFTGRHWQYHQDQARARALLRSAGYAAGLQVSIHLPARGDAEAIADLLTSAYAAVGIELIWAELATLAPGEVPPLYLRLDCGHNITEPLYDLAHDYAPVHPVTTDDGRIGVAGWRPRYVREPTLLRMYREALLAEDIATRRERCLALERAITAFAPAVFLAEQALFNAANRAVPAPIRDHQHRINQVTLFQNGSSSYLST